MTTDTTWNASVSGIDDCDPDPCGPGGTCIDGISDHTCSCHAGFTGDSCETGRSHVNNTMIHVPPADS